MAKSKSKNTALNVSWIILKYFLAKTWRMKKLLLTITVCFCISVPMATHYALANPIKASAFLAEVGYTSFFVAKKTEKAKNAPVDYLYKKTPKGYKKFYDKNIRAYHSYSAEMLNSYGVGVYTPKRTTALTVGHYTQKIFGLTLDFFVTPINWIKKFKGE